jgi:hypothetical protein
MTYAAQFAGRQIAIGESITLNHSSNQVTINGQIFLRAGVLDTVAGYETSLASNPGLGAIVSNTGVYSVTTSTATVLRPFVLGAGTTTFIVTPNISAANNISYRTSNLTGPISSDAGTSTSYAIWDAIAVPAATPYIFMSGYNGPGAYNCIMAISGANPTTLTVVGSTAAANWTALASKPDGSLVIGTKNTIDNASTTIFKWTPAGGSTLVTTTITGSIYIPLLLTWSIAASKFIVIGGNGEYGTSTDGIAWVKLGTTIAGLPSTIDVGNGGIWGQSALCANSTNATVLLARNSVSPFDWYIIRTANGVTFTATSFASLGFYPGAQVDSTQSAVLTSTRITVINNVFYIYRDNGSSNMVSPAIYSSTDGITWTPLAPILVSGMAAGSTNITFLGTISSSSSPFMLFNTLNSANPNNNFTTLPGLAATHVGRTDSTLNQYVRVK